MCLVMVVVISLVRQQCMHPTEPTWHFRFWAAGLFTGCTWLWLCTSCGNAVVVAMRYLWSSESIILAHRASGWITGVTEIRAWPGGGYKELGVISALHLVQESFQCTGKDWCNQEQVAALHFCIVGYTGACGSSAAECSGPWDEEPTASHMNSVFSAPQAILSKPSMTQLPLTLHFIYILTLHP